MNKTLKALLIYNGIFVFASSLLGPLYAVFVETIDSDIFSISLSWAVFLVSSTLFTLFLIKFGDKVFSKRGLFLSGMLVRVVVWPMFTMISSVSGLILLQFLLGFGEALGTPSFRALFAMHLDEGKQVGEYSTWMLIVNLTSAAAVIVGGILVQKLGFDVLFWSMSAISLAAFLALALKPKNLFD